MNITKTIKSLVPVRIKALIKMGSERNRFFSLIREIEQEKDPFDLLIGSPIHTNLGDHLITLAEYQLFKNNYDRKVFEIPTEVFQVFSKRLEKAVNDKTKVFINGGGWMGNIWVNEELLLQSIVNTFSHNKIIIFPQTIFYDASVEPYKELIDRGNNIYKGCKDLSLFTRDYQSYKFAKENFDISKVFLVPDIALYYKTNIVHQKKTNRVGFCLREDREADKKAMSMSELKQLFKDQGYEIKNVTTMSVKRVSTVKREEAIIKKLKEFASFDYIVADRLHGMIFSYLVKTPCIVFDNKTKKVSGVYDQWLSKSPLIKTGFNSINKDEIIHFIENTSRMESSDTSNHDTEFDSLIQEVING